MRPHHVTDEGTEAAGVIVHVIRGNMQWRVPIISAIHADFDLWHRIVVADAVSRFLTMQEQRTTEATRPVSARSRYRLRFHSKAAQVAHGVTFTNEYYHLVSDDDPAPVLRV